MGAVRRGAQLHIRAGRVWSTIRSLCDTPQPSAAKNCALVHHGVALHADVEKANAFCSHYASVSRLSFSREERRSVNLRVRKLLRSAAAAPREACDFTLAELDRAIAMAKTGGAPGPDGVCPRFLKHLGQHMRGRLLALCNTCWQLGEVPQGWRNALVIPLLKAGKPAGQIGSYRPVSLTSCIAKVMERLVAERLWFLAETRGWLSDDQAGFRRLRCTEDQVLRLVQGVSDGFQARARTVAALLDYSQAFDKVWRERLLLELLERGVPLTYVRWLRGFLLNRRACVRFGDATSRAFPFRQGVPQGCVLSPLLFVLFSDSMGRGLNPRVSVSLYADDVALWATDSDCRRAGALVQGAVTAVSDWSRRFKLSLNPSKCQVAFFSVDSREAGWQPVIDIDGRQLPFSANPVFLGVTFDRTLSFGAQARKVCASVDSRRRVLSSLATRDWGWNVGQLRQVYAAFIRPVMDYCAAAWQPWLADTNLGLLERAQNRALRSITGQLNTTPLEALRLEAGVCSYSTWANRKCVLAYERSVRLPPSNPRRDLALAQVRHRLRRCSWRQRALQLLSNAGMTGDRVPLPSGHPAVPWEAEGPVPVSLVPPVGAERSAFATAAYTDGSVLAGSPGSGSATVVFSLRSDPPTLLDTVTSASPDWCSPFDAEVRAVQLAVEWLSSNHADAPSAIYCDCASVLEALASPRPASSDDIERLRASLRKCPGVSVLRTWGHSGVRGNMLADEAARGARERLLPDPHPRAPFAAVRSWVTSRFLDPPPSSERVRAVYAAPVVRRPEMARKDSVLVAQLRSGHCYRLRAYRALVDPSVDPTCPLCQRSPHTLEHWLQVCEALSDQRLACFGTEVPLLSVLGSDPGRVARYARQSLS